MTVELLNCFMLCNPHDVFLSGWKKTFEQVRGVFFDSFLLWHIIFNLIFAIFKSYNQNDVVYPIMYSCTLCRCCTHCKPLNIRRMRRTADLHRLRCHGDVIKLWSFDNIAVCFHLYLWGTRARGVERVRVGFRVVGRLTEGILFLFRESKELLFLFG